MSYRLQCSGEAGLTAEELCRFAVVIDPYPLIAASRKLRTYYIYSYDSHSVIVIHAQL